MGMNVSSEKNAATQCKGKLQNLTVIMCSQASTELSAHFQLFPHMDHVLEGEKQQEGREPSPCGWQGEHTQLLSALPAFLIPESVQFLHF